MIRMETWRSWIRPSVPSTSLLTSSVARSTLQKLQMDYGILNVVTQGQPDSATGIMILDDPGRIGGVFGIGDWGFVAINVFPLVTASAAFSNRLSAVGVGVGVDMLAGGSQQARCGFSYDRAVGSGLITCLRERET